jgi:CubicO group peptidase (beta-lactamase class C family)
MRNSVTGDPVTPDTLMHIGSITKLLNAVLMMQLVDEGRIALEDPVLRYLPELRLRDREALPRITCGMLLNHTSGIDGDILPDHGPDQERIVDAITRCADLGQLHPPGGGPSYSNVATVIAGYLTQTLRGVSWYTLIKTRIYEPLGMQHAIADLIELPRFRHSVGDLTDPATGKVVQTTRPFLPLSFAPCGTTLMMTATDLVTFARALLNGGTGPNGVRILSPASAARMRSPTAEAIQPAGWRWGLGWMLLPGAVLSHSGGGPGVASVVYAHPDTGRVVALLTNCDRYDALKPAILDPILQSWTGLAAVNASESAAMFETWRYEGIYENNVMRVEVVAHEARLALRMVMKSRFYDNVSADGYPAVPLQFLGNDTFAAAAAMPGLPEVQFQFVQPGVDGRMQMLASVLRVFRRAS